MGDISLRLLYKDGGAGGSDGLFISTYSGCVDTVSLCKPCSHKALNKKEYINTIKAPPNHNNLLNITDPPPPYGTTSGVNSHKESPKSHRPLVHIGPR